MSMTPFDDGDDDVPEHQIPDHIRAEADLLMERFGEYEDKMRQLGLYSDGPPQITITPTLGGAPRAALLCQFTIGKVAYSDRVQHPDKNAIDDEARKMEVSLKDDIMLDERNRIAKGLAAGLTIEEIMLGDDEDDDFGDDG